MFGKIKLSTSALFYIFGILCLIITISLLYDPSFLRSDVSQYLSMAHNIKSGNGIKTSILYYDENFIAGILPAPQTVFPFGYPIAIALVSIITNNLHMAAFIISLISFILSGYVLLKIFNLMGILKKNSILALSFWYLLIYNWFITLVSASEMFFILILLGSFYYFYKSLKLNAENLLFISGLFSALAFSIRYFGLFFIIVIAAILALELFKDKYNHKLRRWMKYILFPTLIGSIMFVRNYLISGSIKGGNNLERMASLKDIFYWLYSSFSSLVGFSWNGLKNLYLFEISVILLTLIFFIYLISHYKQFSDSVFYKWEFYSEKALFSAICFVLFSIFALVVLNKSNPDTGITDRIVLPTVPFIIIIFIYIFQKIQPIISRNKSMVNIIIAILGIVFLLGQKNKLHLINKKNNIEVNSIITAIQDSKLHSFLQNWMDINHTEPVLLSNEAQYLGGFLTCPIIGLANLEYSSNIWTEKKVKNIIDKYNVDLIVFFPKLFNEKAKYESNQLFFKMINKRKYQNWLCLMKKNENVAILKIQ